MSGLNRHGMAKCNKQYYKLSGAQYVVQQTILQVTWSSICNELHIDETPHLSYLVRSRLGTQQY